MAAVTVELLRRPPEVEYERASDTPELLDPDGILFVADTDSLLVMCSCSGSSDQPYSG